MSSCGKPLVRSFLARTGVLLVFGATGKAAREHVVDFCCQSRSHVTTEFLFFALIFLGQTAQIGLHVLPAETANFMNGPENNLLRGAVAGAAVSGEVANVSASNIGGAVDREGNTVRNLALPPFGV
jgi:hypothetical protein